MPRRRSTLLGVDPGPETARPAGRHAGGLGRRVRPHDLLPGQTDQGQLRPRPPPPLLYGLAGRAAESSRASCTAQTDEFSYNVVENPVHIHDLNATILHCLGIDHRRLSFKFQGLDMRLTGVEPHQPVRGVLA